MGDSVLARVIVLEEETFLAATACIKQASHYFHCRSAALQHISERCAPSKERIRIRQLYPAIREASTVKNVQRFKYANQVGDALQAILLEHMVRVLFQLIILAIGDAPKQLAGVFVTNSPALHNVEKSAERAR